MLERSLSDTQLLLWWDLEMDEIVVPLRRCPPAGSLTYSTGANLPIGTMYATCSKHSRCSENFTAGCSLFSYETPLRLDFYPREGHIKSLDETRCCRKPTKQQ
ncbi:hypothetical protein V6N13_131322 [Hibiscus sabdariffa]|uniref:Uncharacterized protein n=1 Tax=Hibiscus sabdariffa TaxID=183260 RepID=A0ABR2D8D1_9ROSI